MYLANSNDTLLMIGYIKRDIYFAIVLPETQDLSGFVVPSLAG